MCILRVSPVGPMLAGLLIWSSFPAGPSPTHPPSPLILFSQIIVSNPKPPTQQGPTRPLVPWQRNPGPHIEQNPRPPIVQNPQPPIVQNPQPPMLQQSK
jgi:hypothetical protein